MESGTVHQPQATHLASLGKKKKKLNQPRFSCGFSSRGGEVVYLNMTDAKCLCRWQTFFSEKEYIACRIWKKS